MILASDFGTVDPNRSHAPFCEGNGPLPVSAANVYG